MKNAAVCTLTFNNFYDFLSELSFSLLFTTDYEPRPLLTMRAYINSRNRYLCECNIKKISNKTRSHFSVTKKKRFSYLTKNNNI